MEYICAILVHGSAGLDGENRENDFSHDFHVIIILHSRSTFYRSRVILDGHEVELSNYKIKTLCYSIMTCCTPHSRR